MGRAWGKTRRSTRPAASLRRTRKAQKRRRTTGCGKLGSAGVAELTGGDKALRLCRPLLQPEIIDCVESATRLLGQLVSSEHAAELLPSCCRGSVGSCRCGGVPQAQRQRRAWQLAGGGNSSPGACEGGGAAMIKKAGAPGCTSLDCVWFASSGSQCPAQLTPTAQASVHSMRTAAMAMPRWLCALACGVHIDGGWRSRLPLETHSCAWGKPHTANDVPLRQAGRPTHSLTSLCAAPGDGNRDGADRLPHFLPRAQGLLFYSVRSPPPSPPGPPRPSRSCGVRLGCAASPPTLK